MSDNEILLSYFLGGAIGSGLLVLVVRNYLHGGFWDEVLATLLPIWPLVVSIFLQIVLPDTQAPISQISIVKIVFFGWYLNATVFFFGRKAILDKRNDYNN